MPAPNPESRYDAVHRDRQPEGAARVAGVTEHAEQSQLLVRRIGPGPDLSPARQQAEIHRCQIPLRDLVLGQVRRPADLIGGDRALVFQVTAPPGSAGEIAAATA